MVFHREDIGNIYLAWSNYGIGFKHIIKRREEQGIDVNEFLNDIVEVIEKGKFRKKNDKGNFEFWYNKKMAIISPELQGNKLTFLLTAFMRNKK